jgi:PAS domain S-box-containing protein
MNRPASNSTRPFSGLNLYLFLILMGLCGMLFAQQLPDPALRTGVLLASLSAPLFAGGHLLSRLESGGYARMVLMAGVVMLVAGAAGTMLQFPEVAKLPGDDGRFQFEMESDRRAEAADATPPQVLNFARSLGLLSLVLGVVAILLTVVRREWQIDELGQRFQSLAQHMSDGFILSDANGKVVLLNKPILEMSGLDESAMLGRTADEILNDLKLEPEVIRREESGTVQLHVEASLPAGNRFFWVNHTPVVDRKGRQHGYISTVRDLTEHRHMSEQIERYAEELEELVEERSQQLGRSERRLRDLLMQMNEGVVTVEDDFIIRFVNTRFCDMIQLAPDQVSGRSLLDFLPEIDRGTLVGRLEAARAGVTRSASIEHEVVREDGTRIPVLLARAPFHDERADAGRRYSIVLTDVSELKAMQAQLQEHASELEEVNRELLQLDRTKDSFLTNVSHELRTPLSTIRGYLEMLRSGSLGDLADTQMGAVDVMVRNTERLNTLIAEMISFSRMQIQGVKLRRSLFSVDELVSDSIASVRPDALRNGVELTGTTLDRPCLAWGDSERIAQILSILLSNAVKFCEDGGRVEVSAIVGDDVRISVRDNGIGIPEGQQSRVFDKFYQVDSALNRRYEGAGIGLSIAKSLAEAHCGRIELQSEVGEGSTFTLVMPEAAFDPAVSLPAAGLEAAPILLAIEDGGIRKALSELLTCNGAIVSEAVTSFDGLRKAAENQPAVVVASSELREMSGAALIGKISAERPDSDVRGVVLDDPSRMYEHGDADTRALHLAIPFSPRDALQCIALRAEAAGGRQTAGRERSDSGLILLAGPRTGLIEWLAVSLQEAGFEVLVTETPNAIQEANAQFAVAIVDAQRESRMCDAAFDALRARHETGKPILTVLSEATEIMYQDRGTTALHAPVTVRGIVQALAQADPHQLEVGTHG